MWEIRKELEARKENLIHLLNNKKDFLELEKQHQIYGAIKELDCVIRIIESNREDEAMQKEHKPGLAIKAVTNKSLDVGISESTMSEQQAEQEQAATMKKVSKQVKKFKNPIRIKFSKNDA